MPFDVYKFQVRQSHWSSDVPTSEIIAAVEAAGGKAKVEGRYMEISDETGLVEVVCLDGIGG